jgi:hypothetical protein
MEYETENGYTVRDTLSGLDVEDWNGCHVCELPVNLTHFEDEDGNIDEEKLEQAIEDETAVESFLADQADYC